MVHSQRIRQREDEQIESRCLIRNQFLLMIAFLIACHRVEIYGVSDFVTQNEINSQEGDFKNACKYVNVVSQLSDVSILCQFLPVV